MSADVVTVDGNLVTARITGTLTQVELQSLQKATGEIIRKQGRVKLLVLVENFAGWEQGATWGDFSFQVRHDSSVERMAIVGDRKWADLALLFTSQGLRPFPIEYFDEVDRAQAWLGASPHQG